MLARLRATLTASYWVDFESPCPCPRHALGLSRVSRFSVWFGHRRGVTRTRRRCFARGVHNRPRRRRQRKRRKRRKQRRRPRRRRCCDERRERPDAKADAPCKSGRGPVRYWMSVRSRVREQLSGLWQPPGVLRSAERHLLPVSERLSVSVARQNAAGERAFGTRSDEAMCFTGGELSSETCGRRHAYPSPPYVRLDPSLPRWDVLGARNERDDQRSLRRAARRTNRPASALAASTKCGP